MQNYISKIKKEIPSLKKEIFKKAPDGTHFKVFISDNYVIRFRSNNQKALLREASLLKSLSHSLIPSIIKAGKIDKWTYMIENRLPGKNINTIWKDITKTNQKRIISQIIEFLEFLQSTKKKYIYSISTGKKHNNSYSFYLSGIKKKVAHIKKEKGANEILKSLLEIISNPKNEQLFLKNEKTILVHGDLIIHNLLTDGKNLTGVIDWEMALFGDKNHDVFRLWYYQECARAYLDQKRDASFEFYFLSKLISSILKSDVIKNKSNFYKKYQFVQAIFYLNALEWACNSRSPKKNTNEIISLWNKNRALCSLVCERHFCRKTLVRQVSF